MKFGRVVGIALCLLFVASTIRALYLYRVWTIARTWAKLPPSVSPNPVTFFLPDTWGSTSHGVYADVAFVTVRTSPELGKSVVSWNDGKITPPWNALPANDCGTSDRYRVEPARVVPQNLAPCLGFGKQFGRKDAGKGKSFHLDKSVGGWVSSDDNGYFHLAIYRTR